MPFDVAAVHPDFLIAAVYKWLLAPYGAALMWCAPSTARDVRSSAAGSPEGQREFRAARRLQSRVPSRARAATTSVRRQFRQDPALSKAALEQTFAWGVERSSAYAAAAARRIAAGAAATRPRRAPPEHLRAPHLLGVHLGGADPEAVAEAMAEANVFVSVRGTAMRVAPHVYNDEADVDAADRSPRSRALGAPLVSSWPAMGFIEISELAYKLPGGRVLFSDVTFKVHAGQQAALVGANGVGKTTLLRVLAGEEPPCAAASAIEGRAPLHAADDRVARRHDDRPRPPRHACAAAVQPPLHALAGRGGRPAPPR